MGRISVKYQKEFKKLIITGSQIVIYNSNEEDMGDLK